MSPSYSFHKGTLTPCNIAYAFTFVSTKINQSYQSYLWIATPNLYLTNKSRAVFSLSFPVAVSGINEDTMNEKRKTHFNDNSPFRRSPFISSHPIMGL